MSKLPPSSKYKFDSDDIIIPSFDTIIYPKISPSKIVRDKSPSKTRNKSLSEVYISSRRSYTPRIKTNLEIESYDLDNDYNTTIKTPINYKLTNNIDPINIIIKQPGKLSKLESDIFTSNIKLDINDSNIMRSNNQYNKNDIIISGDFVIAHKWYSRTVHLINILMILIAILLISGGVYTLNSPIGKTFTGDTLPAGSIALGFLFLLTVGCGCTGILMESRILLFIYVLSLMVLLTVQLGIGVALYVIRDQTAGIITDAWINAPNDERVALQNKYMCCGFRTYNVDAGNPCPSDPSVLDSCYDIFLSNAKDNYTFIAGLLIGFLVIEVISFGAAFYNINRVNELRQKNQEDTTYDIPAPIINTK